MNPIRVSFDLNGHDHGGAPVPAAARIGPFVATGGIRGVDCATGLMPTDITDQVENMFFNLRRIVEKAGARVEDILKVTIWISAPEARSAVNPPWNKMFPDPTSRPARHILTASLPGGMVVQCEALAIATNIMEHKT